MDHTKKLISIDHMGGVMVSVVILSVAIHGFKPQSCQINDYEIGICCIFAKQAALRRKSKDWLAWTQDNVSEWGDISITRLLLNMLI